VDVKRHVYLVYLPATCMYHTAPAIPYYHHTYSNISLYKPPPPPH